MPDKYENLGLLSSSTTFPKKQKSIKHCEINAI